MNTISANELKRNGITLIEKLLRSGPVHVIKRNRPVCVVLSEDEYSQLTEATQPAKAAPSHTVMEWFSLTTPGTASKDAIDSRLSTERDVWDSEKPRR